ncbi:MAG: acylase, partial [Xanthomonadales bacterium]|nr:acylase [Xanthomonadales bacterium]
MSATLALAACVAGPPRQDPTRIDWDEWGVPHISAATARALFYADGWAQMDAHANTLLKLYGVSRGRAAEYWGADYLDSDRLVHTLGHPAWAERMWSGQDPELRALISAFSDGINAWAEHRPEAVDPTLRAVLPVRPQDINLHSLFVVNTRFIAGRELALSRRWEDRGSNAIAIAPARSASGNALLLQNPHLPWTGEFLFFEKHLVLPGHNLYGVSLVGLPGLAIGFNDHLGWTHTNNPIDSADLYELALENDGYRYGDEVLAFDKSTVDLLVRAGDGHFETQPLEILRSVHGPVIRTGSDHALALRLVGADRHDSLLQWWRMSTARSLDEFEAALRMAQIPFWNVMYADGAGNIFYLFNGHVPRRPRGDWSYWQGIVDGSDPALLWDDVHAYDELPRLLNPATGWLQNANDPPWTSTMPTALDPDGFPP